MQPIGAPMLAFTGKHWHLTFLCLMAFSRHSMQYLYVSLAEHQIYSILMGLQEYHPQLDKYWSTPPDQEDLTVPICVKSRVCRKQCRQYKAHA